MIVTAENPVVGERSDVSFELMYKREYPQLVRLAYALCGRRDVAEEIVQDAMVKTLARWSKVRDYERPGAFVRRIVLHDTTSVMRRRAAELRAVTRMRSRRGVEDVSLPPDVDEFWRLVRTLPARQAQVVALFYGDDQTTADIAALLGIAEGTVRATLAQARDALRPQLQSLQEHQS